MVYCISVSGGKDSTACALLALECHPKDEIRCVFADTGNEHELTYEYINNYLPTALGLRIHTVRNDFTAELARKAEYCRGHWAAKGVPQETIDRAVTVLKPTGTPFLDLCMWKGRFPARKAQFCTEQLKKFPLEQYQLLLVEEFGAVESWQGVRADESRNRAACPATETTAIPGLTIYRPILTWTAQQVVDYVLSKGIKLNPLYSMNMTRVGCMPCINASKGEILEIYRRFPEHINRIAEWERLVGEASKRGVSTFFHLENHGAETMPDPEDYYHVGNIRSVIEWAQTGHGGRQLDIFKTSTDESPMCSSAYGLCE